MAELDSTPTPGFEAEATAPSPGDSAPAPSPEGEAATPSYTPASFEKRAAAWMGLAYALMVLFLITFSIFTGGRELPGTFPLFVLPVAAAASVVAVYRQRKGTAPGGLPLTVLIVLLCGAAGVFCLLLGAPALISGLFLPGG